MIFCSHHYNNDCKCISECCDYINKAKDDLNKAFTFDWSELKQGFYSGFIGGFADSNKVFFEITKEGKRIWISEQDFNSNTK